MDVFGKEAFSDPALTEEENGNIRFCAFSQLVEGSVKIVAAADDVVAFFSFFTAAVFCFFAGFIFFAVEVKRVDGFFLEGSKDDHDQVFVFIIYRGGDGDMGLVGHQIPLPGKNGPLIFDGIIHRRRGPQPVEGSKKIELAHIL